MKAEVDYKEAAILGAENSVLFSHAFFPNTCRIATPPMHEKVWDLLDSDWRMVNILMSRGWAKTSILRLFTGKRTAYNVSKTILYVGASEKHTRRSLGWLRHQIEHNKPFAQTFGLRKGTPWTDEEMQIQHLVDGNYIFLTGVGITSGSARGINFLDRRPDLIILDDVMNDENSRTKEGREKILDLVFGAFKESLAPRSEAPFAKMVMLNTPQDYEDISQKAMDDAAFKSVRFGCWTPETENMPLEFRESAWPELIPTQELQEEYRLAVARNRLSIFIREKECKLTTPETSAFREEWLQYYEVKDLPPLYEMYTIMVIDPVPPPTEAQLQKGVVEGDYEAITVLGRHRGRIFVLETITSRGHNPTWTISEFFRLAQKWRVRKALVESVAYQSAVSWMLREAMRKVGYYVVVEEFGRGDKRSKATKILDGINGIASNRQLYVNKDMLEFISQYTSFSLIKKIGHDDVIETVAVGCLALQNMGFNLPGSGEVEINDQDDIKELEFRGAP